MVKWDVFQRANVSKRERRKVLVEVEQLAEEKGIKIKGGVLAFRKAIRNALGHAIFKNNLYQVVMTLKEGGVVHLSIKRIDRDPIHDWRHLQRIKNEILGSEWVGYEIYPPESCLIDGSNQYHLWCFRPGTEIVGLWKNGRQVLDKTVGSAKQRSYKETFEEENHAATGKSGS